MKTEVQTTAASKVKGAALIVGVYEGKTAKTVTWTAAGENAAAKLVILMRSPSAMPRALASASL